MGYIGKYITFLTPIATMGVFVSPLYGKRRKYETRDNEGMCSIKSKEDERKWKEFLKTYFPNHYSKRILEEDLIKHNNLIAVSPKGFGYITHKLAHYGQYQEIKDFSQFQATHCYRAILSQGPSLEEGEVEIITIKH